MLDFLHPVLSPFYFVFSALWVFHEHINLYISKLLVFHIPHFVPDRRSFYLSALLSSPPGCHESPQRNMLSCALSHMSPPLGTPGRSHHSLVLQPGRFSHLFPWSCPQAQLPREPTGGCLRAAEHLPGYGCSCCSAGSCPIISNVRCTAASWWPSCFLPTPGSTLLAESPRFLGRICRLVLL